jgi:hypothetical protein
VQFSASLQAERVGVEAAEATTAQVELAGGWGCRYRFRFGVVGHSSQQFIHRVDVVRVVLPIEVSRGQLGGLTHWPGFHPNEIPVVRTGDEFFPAQVTVTPLHDRIP